RNSLLRRLQIQWIRLEGISRRSRCTFLSGTGLQKDARLAKPYRRHQRMVEAAGGRSGLLEVLVGLPRNSPQHGFNRPIPRRNNPLIGFNNHEEAQKTRNRLNFSWFLCAFLWLPFLSFLF